MEPTVKLIEAEIPRLRRYARSLARNPEVADDLVQACLERALRAIDSWQPGTNLRAWLFTILRNCHINEVRRGRREFSVLDASAPPAALAVSGGQEASAALAEVRRAYAKLSAEHREILGLVAMEGLAYEEAAEVLGIALGTVRSRLSRARRALREALEDPGTVPPCEETLHQEHGHG